MMCIVRQEHVPAVFDLEVETAVHAAIGLHASAQLVRRAAVELCHGHGGNAVLYVDGNGLSQLDILDILYRRDEVEDDGAIRYTDILGVEIAIVPAVLIHFHAFLYVLFHL